MNEAVAISTSPLSMPPAVRPFHVMDLGECEYLEVYQVQKRLVEEKKTNPDAFDRLILVEHPAVFTFGRKCGPVPMIDDDKQRVAIERGGDVTYHNPGQLVAYPILSLQGVEQSVPYYLRGLEEVLILTLADFGIIAERKAGNTGVWVGGQTRKIASLGVAITRWVTYHGSALNVDNDLSGFFEINPCGLPSHVMTSMKQELMEQCPSLAQVKVQYVTRFCQVFGRRIG